jgi:hypothetical protein
MDKYSFLQGFIDNIVDCMNSLIMTGLNITSVMTLFTGGKIQS